MLFKICRSRLFCLPIVRSRIPGSELLFPDRQHRRELQADHQSKQNRRGNVNAADTGKTDTAAAEEIEKLRQEIEELRQTVKEREATISEKDKQITEFALKFADLAQQAQIIAGQAQILQAADKPKAIEAQITAAEETVEPQKKKSFLKRLFGN